MVSSSCQAVKSYELWDRDGVVASGWENLKHGKENRGNRSIEEAMVMLQNTREAVYVDETNIEKLIALNYSDREAGDLADGEIHSFFENRLRTIKRRLDENSHFHYTESEKEMFLEKAGELTELRVGFAEGWKVLNRDMGSFIPLSLIMISIVIMPLFADEAQTKMKELCRSTKNGKKRLDLARIATAFGVPLRLSGSKDFYIHNEIYRFAGKTFHAMVWCPAVAVVLSAFMVGIAAWWLRRRRQPAIF